MVRQIARSGRTGEIFCSTSVRLDRRVFPLPFCLPFTVPSPELQKFTANFKNFTVDFQEFTVYFKNFTVQVFVQKLESL